MTETRKNKGPLKPPSARSEIVQCLFREADWCDLKRSTIARSLKVSESAVSHWRSGRSMPTLDKVEALADLLNHRIVLVQGRATDVCILQ